MKYTLLQDAKDAYRKAESQELYDDAIRALEGIHLVDFLHLLKQVLLAASGYKKSYLQDLRIGQGESVAKALTILGFTVVAREGIDCDFIEVSGWDAK